MPKSNLFIKNLSNNQPTKDITQDDIKNKIFRSTSKKEVIIKISDKVIFSKKTLPIIAGPNGVENRKLIFYVAKYLKKLGVNILRGHAYKPLTFPYRSKTYKESLAEGMDWMDEIKKHLGMNIVTEVTEIRHLDRINLTADILQIGSRNMQNLELLREIALTKKPIILKRHFGASLRDMLGAAEHILVEGNNKLILCERGVAAPHTHRDTSRYMLDVQAIVALKELVKFPIISDPSHASFWAPWVSPLAYASVAAGCDGLIIEMHPDPKKSAVDPLQPLNFKEFKKTHIKIKKLSKFFNKKVV
jgi:3-deoxy-7-phosphoheptulonate synthase